MIWLIRDGAPGWCRAASKRVYRSFRNTLYDELRGQALGANESLALLAEFIDNG